MSYIKTRIALPNDFRRVMELMCQAYFKKEPSLVNIGLASEEQPPPILLNLMYQQLREGMTIIAEDRENCIVGAAINAGSCPWEPENLIEYAERCERGSVRDILKFYAYVTQAPQLWNKYCVLKIFDCASVAVDSKYLGMGIAKRLVKESWYLARDCGYQAFRIDCTSLYTAKIAEGFGWECVFAVSYRRYIDSGGLVFKCIEEPHTEVRVFADRPLICKDYCISNPDSCKIGTVPRGK
ncbi:arylalkylamine N-acetyltransferase 1-like [Venturia canescens]|uniref:arylalkylamine N-acetyltransferase 1-like n=1 Tax=Venturia canescens TaxID=32260 RepID=UPI001C9C2012|nr:arylalkylamine N-acetyltransferase 1-like [Venturia canescens]